MKITINGSSKEVAELMSALLNGTETEAKKSLIILHLRAVVYFSAYAGIFVSISILSEVYYAAEWFTDGNSRGSIQTAADRRYFLRTAAPRSR